MIELLIVLIVVGAVLYVVKLLPIDQNFKTIITVVAVVATVIWLLRNYAPALGVG